MKYAMTIMLAVGAVALAAPASAQLVNGLAGLNYNHEAPIGTKAGGSPATLNAPGEAGAIAGALRNERDAKHMPMMMQAKITGKHVAVKIVPRVVARNDADLRLRTGGE